MQIKSGSFEDCIKLSKIIPEFDSPYEINEYKKRCCGTHHLTLIANMNKIPVGFKIGYDRYKDGSFYSWMGGVIPNFRKNGVARQLANCQESWAIDNSYSYIQMKTRKKHKSMIKFLLKRGFLIKDKIPVENILETRIIMEKLLG
jgi:ribosomal protein S18 acetylase RimI-like enzyme